MPLVNVGFGSDASVGGQPLDQLLIGSVSINSTRPVDNETNNINSLSILAHLNDDELEEFLESLYETIELLLG